MYTFVSINKYLVLAIPVSGKSYAKLYTNNDFYHNIL